MQRLRVRGIEAITARMRALPKALVDRALVRACTTAAAIVRDAAKDIAPKDTGLLKEDIIIIKDKHPNWSGFDARAIVIVKWEGKDAAPYWRHVEFGTSKMAAQPFMRPAFESRKEVALAAMINVVVEAIPAIVKSLGGTA